MSVIPMLSKSEGYHHIGEIGHFPLQNDRVVAGPMTVYLSVRPWPETKEFKSWHLIQMLQVYSRRSDLLIAHRIRSVLPFNWQRHDILFSEMS